MTSNFVHEKNAIIFKVLITYKIENWIPSDFSIKETLIKNLIHKIFALNKLVITYNL
jgi:hypothetical protein